MQLSGCRNVNEFAKRTYNLILIITVTDPACKPFLPHEMKDA